MRKNERKPVTKQFLIQDNSELDPLRRDTHNESPRADHHAADAALSDADLVVTDGSSRHSEGFRERDLIHAGILARLTESITQHPLENIIIHLYTHIPKIHHTPNSNIIQSNHF